MAESSILWNTGTVGDGATTYTEAQVRQWMMDLLYHSDANNGGAILEPNPRNSATAFALTTGTHIAPGSAYVRGLFYRNTAPVAVNTLITTPVVGNTGAYVVLEANWTTKTVRLKGVRNTDGVAALPALTQSDGSVWQYPLWSGQYTTAGGFNIFSGLTDHRTWWRVPGVITQNQITDLSISNGLVGSDVVTVRHRLGKTGDNDWSDGGNESTPADQADFFTFSKTGNGKPVEMVGAFQVTIPIGQQSTNLVRSFKKSGSAEFDYTPMVFLQVMDPFVTSGVDHATATVTLITTTNFSAYIRRRNPADTTAAQTLTVFFRALGPVVES